MGFIRNLRLKNLLSFGPDGQELALGPLNVLIGPNGGGKSNLIDALSILASAPRGLPDFIRASGGTDEWLWKGTEGPNVSSLEADVEYPEGRSPLKYRIDFTAKDYRFALIDEVIEDEGTVSDGSGNPPFYYSYREGHPILYRKALWQINTYRWQESETIDPVLLDGEHSVLSRYKDPSQYPQITYLAQQFARMQFYTIWNFSPGTPPRRPASIDLPSYELLPDGSNLALVIGYLLTKPSIRKEILERVRIFDPNVEDIVTSVVGHTMQIIFHEKGLPHPVPATRLADGILQYLCLLAIFCQPKLPPLICLSQPEANLHPDLISEVADLLVEASSRSQIIVITYSDIILDSLTDRPESIVVCKRPEHSTQLYRLDLESLKPSLDEHRLGELWTSGEIGRNRSLTRTKI